MSRLLWRCCVFAIGTAVIGTSASGQLLCELAPIHYSKSSPTDPVARLAEAIDRGDVRLQAEPKFGVLKSLLANLKVPLSSQTLVFSKTSMQRHLISPSNPRAIYFNDETYVAWIPDGEVIEIASTDPMLGTTFYTIEQNHGGSQGFARKHRATEVEAKIQRRTEQCLFCHASSDTGRVPGLLMQSVFIDSDGQRAFPEKSETESGDAFWPQPRGPLNLRWGGWFVTGTLGDQTHLGNSMFDAAAKVTRRNDKAGGDVTDLSTWFDVQKYPTPNSDVVALLVLQHQVTLHNLLTDTNHRTRRLIDQAVISRPPHAGDVGKLTVEELAAVDLIAERLVDGLLMIDAIEFSQPVRGNTGFATEFSTSGPRDSTSRSLRQLDLSNRVFRYRCSYLIDSPSFTRLPAVVKRAAWKRLAAVLRGDDTRPKYAKLSAQDRSDVLTILSHRFPRQIKE